MNIQPCFRRPSVLLTVISILISLSAESSANSITHGDCEPDVCSPFTWKDVVNAYHLEGVCLPCDVNREPISGPLIVWWTPFFQGRHGLVECGQQACFSTNDRKYRLHDNLKAFMFYGTDFDPLDLPLPRKSQAAWALLHEEAPHNQYMFSHQEALELFNYTSTFRRESHYPLTTQWLKSISQLESSKYLVSTAEKTRLLRNGTVSLINYVQSDCGPHSDRETVVKMIQRHLGVDSYGKCLHNKDLPKHLTEAIPAFQHDDFYRLLGQYKFTLAMENNVCDDYVTEKLWRPLVVGSVPIVLGSSRVKDFLPSEKSAIVISDYDDIQDVVNLIRYLDANDDEYEKYLEHKRSGVANEYLRDVMRTREWGLDGDANKPHFIEAFECYVCRKLHEDMGRSDKPISTPVTREHYGCPRPKRFSDRPPGNLTRVDDVDWAAAWETGRHMARVLGDYVRRGRWGYSKKEFYDDVLHSFTPGDH